MHVKFITIGMTLCAITFGFSNLYPSEISTKNDGIAKFELSDFEKRNVEEFLNSIRSSDSFELGKVLDAAHGGNAIAMYIVGQCSLSGTGTSINRNVASHQFRMAASSFI